MYLRAVFVKRSRIIKFCKGRLLVDVTALVHAPVADANAPDPEPIATRCVKLQLAA
jgi:hypothetical protein